MSIRVALLAVVLVSLTGGRAARADVALGASFGYTHTSYPDFPPLDNNVLGLPGAGAWAQPGIRIGYVAPNRRWDLNTDVGLVHVHRSGTSTSDETTIEVLPQIQANMRARGGLQRDSG